MEIKHDDKLKEGEEACFQVKCFSDECIHNELNYDSRLHYSILMYLVRED